jgi:hypothetical protein
MCASPKAVPHRPRPAWNRLFAILPLATAVLVLIEVTVATGPLRVAAEAAIVLAGFGAMALWVRGNRAALAQLERCNCASEMLAIRVIASRPDTRPRQGPVPPVPAAAPVSALTGQWTGARLGE